MQIFLIVIFCIITSCGFSPVYSQKDDNTELAVKLASVDVKPIKSIIGQQYVNALVDALDPSGINQDKQYILEANVTKSTVPLAIEKDRTISRYKVVVSVEYKIKEIETDKYIANGSASSEADYDKVVSDYATYVSENDTMKRAIKELAQDTKVRVISDLLRVQP